MILASDKQLEVLQKAKTWYMDVMFKLCRHPLTQLLQLNASVKNDDHVKQVPLVFAVMSGGKKRDYKAVLEAVLSVLPDQRKVKRVTLDFEKVMWSAMSQVLPDVELKGCSFHWTRPMKEGQHI